MYIKKINETWGGSRGAMISSKVTKMKQFNRINDYVKNDPDWDRNMFIYGQPNESNMFPLKRRQSKKK